MVERKHTPGPWHACRNGECSCSMVSSEHHPVAHVIRGEWGDEFASIRLVGETSLSLKAEPFIDRSVYGSVSEECAKANAQLIAAAPDLLSACEQAAALFEDDESISAVLRAAIAKAHGDDHG